MTREEADLVSRAVRGDPEATNEVLKKYSAYVNRTAWSIVRNPADAADITQLVLIKMVASLPTLKLLAGLQTWIYRITYRTSLNWLRTLKKLPAVELDDVTDVSDDDPELRQEKDARIDRVIAAAEALPAPYLLLVKMFYFEDRSCREIANIVDQPEGTVRVQLHRARQMILRRLRAEGTKTQQE